ncbi:hypothetical protein [Bradyrhizobium sp. WSM2254]|uniref:hypothetical protein n=1 Tax=Bradyrhizobium sp. WSM2254 TaxID=1188263 RepID=UPI000675F48E|nr:hypothetical protein [Bradyrhizobium sp. WSM2254]
MKKISKSRLHLLLEIERIIGGECYNAKTQNWGPNGVFEGKGRHFPYPITFIDSDGNKVKRKNVDNSLSAEVAITGYYAFGANQLLIIQALDKVIRHLEDNHGLSIS